MLMVSIVLDQQISTEIEENLSNLCAEFSERLQSNEEIYTAFYIKDLNSFDENDKEIIAKNEALIEAWVNNLYWAIVEFTWEKTEEEKIAILLNDKHIFETLEKLSNGPIPLEWLREWFVEEFPEKNFEEIIDTLVDKQFIFINQIGLVEKYVLLCRVQPAQLAPEFRPPPQEIRRALPRASMIGVRPSSSLIRTLPRNSYFLTSGVYL